MEAVGKEVHSLVHEELEKMRHVLTESQKQKPEGVPPQVSRGREQAA
jgi:hypothetical protein